MKECLVCKISEGKYKCPTCYIYYCSVVCCKNHKESCVPHQIKSKEVKEEKPVQMFVTQDTVPGDKLSLLGHDKSLKDLLNNPHLRQVLKTIDTAKDAEEIMHKAMQEPLFVEFADACLKIVEEPGS